MRGNAGMQKFAQSIRHVSLQLDKRIPSALYAISVLMIGRGATPMASHDSADLSRRERLALMLMIQKYSAAEIGEALNLSERAARDLIARVARRLVGCGRERERLVALSEDEPQPTISARSRRLH
jgi:DNA-binding CsgD family transcriptional regulator